MSDSTTKERNPVRRIVGISLIAFGIAIALLIAKGEFEPSIIGAFVLILAAGLFIYRVFTTISAAGRFIGEKVIHPFLDPNPRHCPFCREGPIKQDAVVCRYCHRDLPPAACP